MAYEFLETSLDGAVFLIRLNRPDCRNIMTFRISDELRHAFAFANQSDDVKVVILTRNGDYFCAGGEFSGDIGMDPNSDAYLPFQGRSRDPGGLLTMQMYELKKLIIVAYNGPAIGFGMFLQLDYFWRD